VDNDRAVRLSGARIAPAMLNSRRFDPAEQRLRPSLGTGDYVFGDEPPPRSLSAGSGVLVILTGRSSSSMAWERIFDHQVEEAGMSIVGRHIVEPPETRMVLENVAWETYVALADQRRGSVPCMTYDDGVLEMMSPQREHENIACLIGRMIETYSEVRDIEIISFASVTVKRSDLSKAYEADESYYVTHAAELLGKRELDFEVDPPPDMVVEVEITSSAIKTMLLFAAMKVPEVWRHNGESLNMYPLEGDAYVPIDSSVELPGLSADRINQHLAGRDSIGETKLIQRFRKAVSRPGQGRNPNNANRHGQIPGALGRSQFGLEIIVAIAYLVYVVGL
jgi:Uma2 family endonuclease